MFARLSVSNRINVGFASLTMVLIALAGTVIALRSTAESRVAEA